jgi:hypothetical protein
MIGCANDSERVIIPLFILTEKRMQEMAYEMEQLQVTGANLGAQLEQIRDGLEAVRTAKLGSKQPRQWVVPLSASKLTVNTAKLASLNAKRRVGDRIDTLLLELVRLQEAARAAQELSYKHFTLKLLQANSAEDARADTEERQARQDARVEEAAKRSELAAARKCRRVVVESDGEASDFDLR